MPQTRLAFLFSKYYQKTATAEEKAEFMQLAAMEEHAAELQQLLGEAWAEPDEMPVFTETESEDMLRHVLQVQEVSAGQVVELAPAGLRLRGLRIVAAAAVLAGLGLGTWWYAHPLEKPGMTVAVTKGPVAAPVPGGNKAVLILADGSTVTLDSTKNGLVAKQGGSNVMKLAGGQLAYASGGRPEAKGGASEATGAASQAAGRISQAAGEASQAAVLYNTVRTPKGGQYEVTLPDGSRVWLNAATSLRFPTAFTGSDRTVELSGEAYFEVASSRDRPFIVKVGEMTVDVLGTHFNVMAYGDEERFRTTLLSGAVRVAEGGTAKVLKPGDAASLSLDAKQLSVAKADTDQAVAWKNGLFQFERAGLKEVMRQVSRWYDVDVQYEGTVDRHFSGFIARSASLADVLHQLERAGKTSFTLEGRTVTVKPK
jgi:ferric-dicitrate binding protein FerR (iron transport regulator)